MMDFIEHDDEDARRLYDMAFDLKAALEGDGLPGSRLERDDRKLMADHIAALIEGVQKVETAKKELTVLINQAIRTGNEIQERRGIVVPPTWEDHMSEGSDH